MLALAEGLRNSCEDPSLHLLYTGELTNRKKNNMKKGGGGVFVFVCARVALLHLGTVTDDKDRYIHR